MKREGYAGPGRKKKRWASLIAKHTTQKKSVGECWVLRLDAEPPSVFLLSVELPAPEWPPYFAKKYTHDHKSGNDQT